MPDRSHDRPSMLGITPQALASTYTRSSKDPWEVVHLYRTATAYPDDWGAQRVATAINTDPDIRFTGVTRSQIRVWVDGDGMPDAARAVATTDRYGWTANDWTATTRALATLVVGGYVCGSITTTTYAPSWSPANPDTEQRITTALAQVGCDATHVSRDSPKQGDEYRPKRHASHLGRALTVAGMPVGDKNAKSVTALPGWIDEIPEDFKLELARLIVRERGTTYPRKATRQIQTDRGPQYFQDIAKLISDVTEAAVTATPTGVTVPAAAVRALGLTTDSASYAGVLHEP